MTHPRNLGRVFDLDSLTLVPAYWQIVPDAPRPIDIIGIHSAEAAELPSTAEALGAYFNRHPQITGGRKASTHLGVDVDSVGFYVPFENIAYAAGGINQNGIHIEHAGYARQTRAEWLDDYSEPMLRLSASLTAALCVRYNIPAMWLAPDDLLQKRRGITSHVNACIAFGGDHWDPGYEFPEDLYIKWVREEMEGQPMAALTVHHPTLRSPGIWDFTYLPADGAKVGSNSCISYVCFRSVGYHHPQPVQVWCDGQMSTVEAPGDGRTVVAAVNRPGLVSVVGEMLKVEARELWM